MRQRTFRIGYVGLAAMLLVTSLAGCGQETPDAADEGGSTTYTSETLDTSYDGALNASSQLALGTLRLEETENAVSPDQAEALLPLWKALQGGVTAEVEVNAVLKQIEGTMTPQQVAAIAAMQLTQDDLRAWMQEQGPGFPGPGEGQGMPPEGQEPGSGFPGPAEGQGAPPEGEEGSGFPGRGEGRGMSPELQATRQAEFENMSEEEREALQATMQAGGGFPGGPGGSRGGAAGGQFIVLLRPLIQLLETRAAE